MNHEESRKAPAPGRDIQSVKVQSVAGISGRCRVVKHDVAGLRGSGPNGSVDFHDLWEEGPDGQWVSKHPERITVDRTYKNKILCRGLSYFSYWNLYNKTGTAASKMPSCITHYHDRNPFTAFVLIGDDHLTTPTRRGDAKVEWHESDTEFDDKIPAGDGSVGIGRRGITLATTTGIFRKIQIRYLSTDPYDEQEITLFAQANDPAEETGNDGLDNFVAKGYGFAYGYACGYNEADSQVGLRAVLGLPPTFQGAVERDYHHENCVYNGEGLGSITSLHKYDTGEDVGTYGEGYVSSYEPADVVIATYAAATIQFVGATNRISVSSASFDADEHTRKMIAVDIGDVEVPGSPFTIKRVISPTIVEVFDDISDMGPTSANAKIKLRTTGDKCFDGRVENECLFIKAADDGDPKATIIQGEKWVSEDDAVDHRVGRVWASDKVIRYVRIVMPAGSNRDFCPDKFLIQTLNEYHHGTTDPPWPEDDDDWTTRVNCSAGGEATNIFSGEEYGYEYDLGADRTTKGVRLCQMRAADVTRKVEIGEIYMRGALNTVEISGGSNVLKFSVDGGSTWKSKTIPATTMTTDMEDIVNALNGPILGFGAEAARSTFGYLLLRATMAGNYSTLHVDSEGGGSTINSDIGLPSAGGNDTGETEPFTKDPANAVTFIYTSKISGNLPKP
jgi:hypothetical protein